jgi:DNA (cytosine-5)-methyltransferase 1
MQHTTQPKCIELFAGVGGFRLGLEKAGWDVTWSNQWEPNKTKQWAAEVYRHQFGDDGFVNEDICNVNASRLPDHDLLVGGFPCQDYSVAKPLKQSAGIQGKKGVLWWEIFRILQEKNPTYVLLENVSRLLSTPTNNRGRDFATILACFNALDYVVEWQVINAGDYGYPQSRKRVFILAYKRPKSAGEYFRVNKEILREAFPYREVTGKTSFRLLQEKRARNLDGYIEDIPNYLHDVSTEWDEVRKESKTSPFMDAGMAYDGHVLTTKVKSTYNGPKKTLETILQDKKVIPEDFFIPEEKLGRWEYLKGSKKEQRVHKETGTTWQYSEGAVTFPDALNRPSRTIVTGEGGTSPSRFKHVIQTEDGRYRRLTPVELERLNGFPDGWTSLKGCPDKKITDGQRAFLMGNALVVGIIEQIGKGILNAKKVVKDE